jgi:hypothetical protein
MLAWSAPVLAALIVLPFLVPPWQTVLLSYGLVLAIAALGFNLLLGYTDVSIRDAIDIRANSGGVYGPTSTCHTPPVRRTLERRYAAPARLETLLRLRHLCSLHRPGWVYEEKYDGWRVVAYSSPRQATRA